MDKMLSIDSVRHHVAICGRVAISDTAADQPKSLVFSDPVQRVRVEIIAAPERFQRQLQLKSLSHGQAWESFSDRPDRTHTAIDGSFYLIDLPPGSYTLRASWFPKKTRSQVATAVVTVVDGQKPPWVDLTLTR